MAEEQAVDSALQPLQGGALPVGPASPSPARRKDLVGTDSEEANKGSDGDEHSSAEGDAGDAEAQGSDEESASGEQDTESASGQGRAPRTARAV